MDQRPPERLLKDLAPLLYTYARNNAYGGDEEDDIYQDAVLFLLEKGMFKESGAEGDGLSHYTSRQLRYWMSHRKDSIYRRTKGLRRVRDTILAAPELPPTPEEEVIQEEGLRFLERAVAEIPQIVDTLSDLQQRVCHVLMTDPTEEALAGYVQPPSRWTGRMLARVLGVSPNTIHRAIQVLVCKFADSVTQ